MAETLQSWRSGGSEPYIGLLSPLILYQKDRLSECLALKCSRSYSHESQRAIGNRDAPLKGCAQNLKPFTSSAEAVVWKEPRSDACAHFWRASQWSRKQLDLCLGWRYWWQTVLRPGSTVIVKALPWQVSFGILLLASSRQGLTQPSVSWHKPQALQGMHTVVWGPGLTTSELVAAFNLPSTFPGPFSQLCRKPTPHSRGPAATM